MFVQPTYLQRATFTMETRTRSRTSPDGGGSVEYCTRRGRIALYPRMHDDDIDPAVVYDLSIPRPVFEEMGFPRVVTVTFQRGDRLNDEGVA